MKEPRKRIKDFETLHPLDNLKQQERIDIIAGELCKARSKKSIIDEYTVKWECSPHTIKSIIQETLIWMQKVSQQDTEAIRILNSERLDGMLDECETVRDKCKIKDLYFF